ncbi:MAG TPA: alpha/beta hydrolase [Alphaproteobacteria bacterium]|nr:alpha/beta hydrolase [Alphaproteobacteria bacterium]
MTDTTAVLARPTFLDSGRGVSIAYHSTPGKSPGVMFCGGFMSDMTGSKALALEAFCRERGQGFVRFDYAGHGQSSGRCEDGTIGSWTEDALAVLDRVAQGPQVIVGSSMGGWIALNLALARADRVTALVGIAAAPDFTEDLIWHDLPTEAQMMLETDGVIYEPSEYSDKPYPITMTLIHEARAHLRLRGEIAIDCPVRLLHGMVDPDVPWKRSLTLAEKLRTQDVRVILVKDGDHRLSREQDLALLTSTVGELLTV